MFKRFLKKIYSENIVNDGDRVVVGFSGGPDSVFLSEMLIELKKYIDFEFYLVHINHLLRGESSDLDEIFCKEYAERNRVDIFVKQIPIKEIAKLEKKGLEVVGREARYQFFYEVMQKVNANKIAIAHNLDDQIENFLFRLMRGTTLKGLEGIKEHSNIIRPINEIYKADILDYLEKNGVKYRVDESNLESCFTRNSIRLELIPYIEKRYNPQFKEKIVNLMTEIREVNTFFEIDIENYTIKSEKDVKLDLDKVFSENTYIQKRVICEYLYNFDIVISNEKINSILNLLFTQGSKQIDLGNNHILIKEYNTIKVENKEICKEKEEIAKLKIQIPFSVEFGNYIIEAKITKKGRDKKNEFFTNLKEGDFLEIRTRAMGDRIKPLGMNSYKKVKDVLINEKVPKLERDKIPLLLKESEVVWIPEIKRSEEFKSDNEIGVKLLVRRKDG